MTGPSKDDLFKNPYPGQAALERDIDHMTEAEALEELARITEENNRLRNRVELAYLYGWNWYGWARQFYESINKINLLCAANQISKSSTQIRKCINWATDTKVWPSLWKQRPVQFWYLYPTRAQVNQEFEVKWKPQFLPSGAMKDDAYYGWKEERKYGDLVAIHFNSGVHVYFKTYAQDTAALQTGTCDAIFCDEELPIEHYEELMFRLSAADGYFHMVFTATLGQDFWRRAMDPGDQEKEELPDAFKQTVSLYDAMAYEDGTPSHWTLEKIKRLEARCSTKNEILKRIHGKFIFLGGLKYESFDSKRHVKKAHPIPESWLVTEGVDIGSGGKNGHKSAICFVGVSPDYRKGRVFLGWRGADDVETTAGDVFVKHQEMIKDHKVRVTNKFYDWGASDFAQIAQRAGDPFEKAEKSHEIGEDTLNTLFKNDMLLIYEDEAGELHKLVAELVTLKKDENKRKAKDDFADALRYAVTKIPWDWTILTGAKGDSDESPEEVLTPLQREIKERRKAFEDDNQAEKDRIEDEFAYWNDQYS